MPFRSLFLICALISSSIIPATAQDKIKTIATFSILGDLLTQVAGDKIEITTLVGPNGDAHVYTPKPSDTKAIAQSQLIFTNGLSFEGWMTRLIKASGTKANVVIATKGISPLKSEQEHDTHHKHDHDEFDPHAWQSVANIKIYVTNIKEALIKQDPANTRYYEQNAADYISKLEKLETEIKEKIASIPQKERRIITSHDAFRYFEKAYELTFIPAQGLSTDTEANAKQVARLITQIKKEKVKAIFVENISDQRLIKRISEETNVKIGGTLYSDALSDDKGPANTYINMMRHNINAIIASLNNS